MANARPTHALHPSRRDPPSMIPQATPMRLAMILLASVSIAGVANAAGTARDRLDAFAHGLHALRGDFSQTVYDQHGRVSETSRGMLALQAPRQFRWQVTSPYKQLIVADGRKVWVYDPELEQVTVRNQGAEEAHSPLTVLTDLSQLDSEFEATEAGTREGLDWLRLVSRHKDSQFEYAEIGFAADGPRAMVFKDNLGDRTEIVFSDWQRNPSLPAGTFAFTPPPGADVVGDTVPPSAQSSR
jgi:outer membrane lipoprotein carrier protein